MIKAEIICDSIATTRLTTFKLRYPRFIHAEFMTHRMISRNASSSRALPVAKLLEEVRSDELRAAPMFWGAEQKGMQTGDELPEYEMFMAQESWKQAALSAAKFAELLAWRGAHKSIVNRLLEPFSHINVVATATEWDNFFGLRLHKDAEPTMRALAVAMWEARQTSKPTQLNPGQWHLPFVYAGYYIDGEQVFQCGGLPPIVDDRIELDTAIKISVARCARTSYESFPKVLEDGTIVPGKRSTIEEDLKLYDRLVGAQPLHASPAEHQATPDHPALKPPEGWDTGPLHQTGWFTPHEHGNFVGWRQYRKMLSGEAQAPLPEEYK